MKEKLDKKGRIIKKEDLISGLVYDYKYEQNKRIVKISLKRCKSKTILTEEKLEETYLVIKEKNFSENYIITTIYENPNRVKKIIRYNRKTKKRYIKENIIFNENEPVFWVERYSGKTDFGFKINLAKHNF